MTFNNQSPQNNSNNQQFSNYRIPIVSVKTTFDNNTAKMNILHSQNEYVNEEDCSTANSESNNNLAPNSHSGSSFNSTFTSSTNSSSSSSISSHNHSYKRFDTNYNKNHNNQTSFTFDPNTNPQNYLSQNSIPILNTSSSGSVSPNHNQSYITSKLKQLNIGTRRERFMNDNRYAPNNRSINQDEQIRNRLVKSSPTLKKRKSITQQVEIVIPYQHFQMNRSQKSPSLSTSSFVNSNNPHFANKSMNEMMSHEQKVLNHNNSMNYQFSPFAYNNHKSHSSHNIRSKSEGAVLTTNNTNNQSNMKSNSNNMNNMRNMNNTGNEMKNTHGSNDMQEDEQTSVPSISIITDDEDDEFRKNNQLYLNNGGAGSATDDGNNNGKPLQKKNSLFGSRFNIVSIKSFAKKNFSKKHKIVIRQK